MKNAVLFIALLLIFSCQKEEKSKNVAPFMLVLQLITIQRISLKKESL